MERGARRDDRRRKEDTRDHRPRYDRERSRSPPPRDRRDDRRRERSPPRGPGRGPPPRADRDRDHNRRREDSRSRSPPRRPNDRGPPPRQPLDTRSTNPIAKGQRNDMKREQPRDVKMQNGVEDEDSDAEMQRVMGFKGFRSTKNTKVPGNDKNYGVYKAKKTEYRQYMNRTGGFNRPLSPSRT